MERVVRDQPLTDEELAKYDRIRQQVAAELPAMIERNRVAPGHRTHEDVLEVQQLVAFLRAERERQQLDLPEIARRTHYRLEDLELLESDRNSNPPVAMLTRYANALGRRMLLVLRQGEPWHEPRDRDAAAQAHP
jgi:hypothetical protein